MPAPSVCTVSGTVYGPNGVALSGVGVEAYVTSSFTDVSGNYIAQGLAAYTTTDANGAWSLSVVRTSTLNRSITFQFSYPLSTGQAQILYYPASIPNTSTANFSDLVSLTNP